MTGLDGPSTRDEHGQLALEAAGQLGQRHGGGTRRRHLDREREAVEPVDDLLDGGPLPVVGVEVGTHRAGPFEEQLERRGARRPRRQGRDRPPVLPLDAESLAARGQHPHAGSSAAEDLDRPGGRVGQVLAVVEDGEQVEPAGPGERPLRGPGLDGQPQPVGDRVEHGVGVAHPGELDEPGPPLEAVGDRGGDGQGQPGLADPTGPDERDDATVVEQLGQGGEVPLPAHQRRGRHRQGAVGEIGLPVGERRGLGPPEPVGGLEPGVGEHRRRPLVRAEGLGEPGDRGQRLHEDGPRPLAQGMLRHQLLGRADRVGRAAGGQEPGGPGFAGGDPPLLQPDGGSPHGLHAGDVAEGRAPPQRERLVEEVDGDRRRGRGGPVDELLEPLGVDLLGRDVEHVPGGPDRQHVAERPSQPGHVGPEGARGAAGRVVAPEGVDEQVGGDGDARAGGEHRQHDPLAAAPHGHRPAVHPQLDVAEHPHEHPTIVGGRGPGGRRRAPTRDRPAPVSRVGRSARNRGPRPRARANPRRGERTDRGRDGEPGEGAPGGPAVRRAATPLRRCCDGDPETRGCRTVVTDQEERPCRP
ncbi:MAG: hypothetical protein M5U14_21770 [Acidimicrobiia bacterium]|nr:hypothetical protein [Acidimicrobiia bacterium]